MKNISKIDINGIPFYVRDYSRQDESVLRKGIETNNYQLPDSMEGLTVVDIGAFIGGISILCAKRGATVYCAEPSKDNFRLLLKNIKLNSLEERIYASRVALGESKNTHHFTRLIDINHSNRASNVLRGLSNSASRVNETERVSIQTLKEFFSLRGIKKCDILKMDCEGAEIELLDDIVEMQIPLIVCELHFRNISNAFDEKLSMYLKTALGGCDIKYTHL